MPNWWENDPSALVDPAQSAAPSAPSSGWWEKDPPAIGDVPLSSSGSFAEKAMRKLTGEGRMEFDLPEIGDIDLPWAQKAKLMALSTLSSDPEQVAAGVRDMGGRVHPDSFGNLIVQFGNGQMHYINRPGVSAQDVLPMVGQGAIYAATLPPAARAATTVLGKAATSGLAGATTSAGIDVGAYALGADKVVDLPKAGLVGAASAGFEMLAPIVGPVWRALSRNPANTERVNLGGSATVRLTPQGRKELADMLGIEMSQLSDDLERYFIEAAKDAANPAIAARYAESRALPMEVPMRQGKITQNPGQQMQEDIIAKGGYGETPSNLMRGLDDRTQEALRGNVAAIQNQLGGGVVQNAHTSGELVQRRLGQLYKQQKGVTGAAYSAAEASPAMISIDSARSLVDDMANSARPYLRHSPSAQAEIKRLEEFLDGLPTTAQGIPVNEVFNVRRDIGNLASNAANDTERAAFTGMKKQLDKSMRDMVRQSLIVGDDASVGLWAQAIRQRAKEGRLFQSDDLVGDLVRVDKRSGRAVLEIPPEAATNYIFGISNMGLMNKPQLIREVTKMRRMLGNDSPEWLSMKEELFLRIAREGESVMNQGVRAFSGDKMKKAWDTFRQRNPKMIDTFFSKEEQNLISRFANVAARATGSQPGGALNSTTTLGLSRMMTDLFNWVALGPKGKAILSRVFPPAYEAIISGRVAAQTKAAMPVRQIPAGYPGAAGAITTIPDY